MCANTAWSLKQCKRLEDGSVEKRKLPGLLRKIRCTFLEQVTLIDKLIAKNPPRPRLTSSPIPQSSSSSNREKSIPIVLLCHSLYSINIATGHVTGSISSQSACACAFRSCYQNPSLQDCTCVVPGCYQN